MSKIRYFIIPIFLLFTTIAFAQKGELAIDKESNWQDRIYYGGGFGLSGGSWGTSISVTPIVGYMISNRVSAGIGATYQFYKYQNGIYDYTDNRWGMQFFTRVNLIKQVFAYAEYSFINYSYFGDTDDRRTANRLPLGLGISQPIGPRSALNIVAAYDVLYDSQQQSIYGSPWVISIFFSL
jgi:hypothetical protein